MKLDRLIYILLSLEKEKKITAKRLAEEIQEIVNRFVVDQSPWWGQEQTMPQMDLILQAVFQLHKLEITYHKMNLEVSTRTIRPYGIVIKEMIWYLVGYCEDSFAIRMFRCDRITDCNLINDTFVYPKNFELKNYFQEALQGIKEKCALEEQYFATMIVNEKAFRYLKGMEYSILSHEENQWKICVNLYGFENALNDYWNILMNATSINPVELKQAICEKLTAQLNHLND